MFTDPNHIPENEFKTEQDLIEILKKNPLVTVTKSYIDNVYVIGVYRNESRNLHDSILIVSSEFNGDINVEVPYISHQISGKRIWEKVSFRPEGVVCELIKGNRRGKTTKERMSTDDRIFQEIMKFAKTGLEIVSTYKRIPVEERKRIGEKYCDRIDIHSYEAYQEMPDDCVESALEGIYKELE